MFEFVNAWLILATFLNSITVDSSRVKKSVSFQTRQDVDSAEDTLRTMLYNSVACRCKQGQKDWGRHASGADQWTSGWIPLVLMLNKELLSGAILVPAHCVKSLIDRCHIKTSSYPYMICLWRAALLGPVLLRWKSSRIVRFPWWADMVRMIRDSDLSCKPVQNVFHFKLTCPKRAQY